MTDCTAEILIVEDNAGDARLISEVLNEGKLKDNFTIVSDGVDAIDYLFKKGKFRNSETPGLVILDLNLPKKDGREVLAEIKSDDSLMKIPVIILTMSQADDDILKSYSLHANSYIIKPIDFDLFRDAIKSIESFWFSSVTLPSENKK